MILSLDSFSSIKTPNPAIRKDRTLLILKEVVVPEVAKNETRPESPEKFTFFLLQFCFFSMTSQVLMSRILILDPKKEVKK